MDKYVQMLDKNHGALSFQTAWECTCVFRTNRTREAEGRLLWPVNEKGRGVWCVSTLVFKTVFLGDERRALDGENLNKKALKKETWTVEDRDWIRKRGDTLNAGGVGGLESMV
ncbi:hypothetical protein TNCV_1675201 [Trichonephila clavipes]|nr:hypothetical protein TNCV_1675201 [Trichonephila clavipes]